MPNSFNFSFVIQDVTKVLIVLTDGHSDDSVALPAQRLKNDGIIVYSIRLGSDVSNSELQEIASLPSNKHVFLLSNFQELASIPSQMCSIICKGKTTIVKMWQRDLYNCYLAWIVLFHNFKNVRVSSEHQHKENISDFEGYST